MSIGKSIIFLVVNLAPCNEQIWGVEVQLHIFLILELEMNGHLHSLGTLSSGHENPVRIIQEAGFVPGPVWTLQKRNKISYACSSFVQPIVELLYRLCHPGFQYKISRYVYDCEILILQQIFTLQGEIMHASNLFHQFAIKSQMQ